MDEKGSGMQRSVALALLQVYAEELTKHPENNHVKKPFFLLIDEPEICLHPKAQNKLFSALLELSKSKQIFLTTHSPYFLATKELNKIGLFIFKQIANSPPSIEKIYNNNGLLPWSPTWGEINYEAYNLATIEFHNELYGRLQEVSEQWTENTFETWLSEEKGVQQTKEWTPERQGAVRTAKRVTLQTFIRNKIHHPENETMQPSEYSDRELETSITKMISIIRELDT